MKLTRKGMQEVKEVPYGVYLWQMPDGKYVGDGEGHFLMIASMEGDNDKMKALARAARDCGVEEGMPCFFRGNRIVNDEEYEEQRLRFEFGLVPDPLDIAAVNESRRNGSSRR
jgi:hypothetical protein